MGIKIYAYIGAALLIAAAMWWFDNNGYQRCQAAQALAEKAQLKADSVAVDEVKQKEKVREKIIYKWKTKIRTVKETSCYKLNDPIASGHVDELRGVYNSIAGQKAN